MMVMFYILNHVVVIQICNICKNPLNCNICLRVLHLIVLQQMTAEKRKILEKFLSWKFLNKFLWSIRNHSYTTSCISVLSCLFLTHTHKLFFFCVWLAGIQVSKYHRCINLFWAHFVNFYHQMKFATFGMHNIEFSIFLFFLYSCYFFSWLTHWHGNKSVLFLDLKLIFLGIP